ncbi:MAG: pentapeptide repeat-containing protein, partial [Gemmatimonadetes bacterium]|nr:pentapeptide repeat-containing protein [Gemmatimonadota bacterium]
LPLPGLRAAPRRPGGGRRGLPHDSDRARGDLSRAQRDLRPVVPRRLERTAVRGTAVRGTAFRGTASRGTAFRGTAFRGAAFRGAAFRGAAFRGAAFRRIASEWYKRLASSIFSRLRQRETRHEPK